MKAKRRDSEIPDLTDFIRLTREHKETRRIEERKKDEEILRKRREA
jgi:hypothetical protein